MKKSYFFYDSSMPILLFAFILFFPFCNSEGQQKMKSPVGYDLNNPEIVNLTKKIDEISGIAYSKTDSSLFAIDDDKGDLYNIPLTKNPQIKKWKFGKNADYEDIILVDTTFYILESSGKIISFPFQFPITNVEEYSLDLRGRNEFESLYFDSTNYTLVLLCKQCKRDNAGEVSAYGFDVRKKTFSDGPLGIIVRKWIEAKLDKKISRLKASATAINPLTGEIFIISSINKLLIITDRDYNVKEVYELKRRVFGQPEGICFAPDGTMFISNEASKDNKANILIFKYQN